MTDARAIPAGTEVVPALYVPKSLKIEIRADGVQVRIKSPNVGAFIGGFFALLILSFVVPVAGFIGGAGFALLIFLLAIGLWVYLWLKGVPPIFLSPSGVRVGNRFYRLEDISGFADHADDGWLVHVISKTGMDILGLHYGIYAVRLPYLLSQVEAIKVALHLNFLLKALAQPGIERERKIQQAQTF